MRTRLVRCVTAMAVVTSALAFAPRTASAQYFGRNKVQYEAFDFTILRTEHFDIYYDPPAGDAVQIAARLAERWYARLSRVLGHTFRDRQPLILYGSHPDFVQTNVVSDFLDDGIGGVTESLRRRIVMPFAASLGETDRILGHEIVHAFQYDIARHARTSLALPLWFIEGMAEYLAVGAEDPITAMWLRDAVNSKRLPTLDSLGRRGLSPYRYGQAVWAYLAGRFGDEVMTRALKEKSTRGVLDRITRVTGTEIDALSRAWHDAVREAPLASRTNAIPPPRSRPLVVAGDAGRVSLAPVLSPDGREIVFFSEKGTFSLDLFLANAVTGEITRKLATTTTGAQFESLQFVNSAGTWDRAGTRFAFAAIRAGRPVVTIVDVRTGASAREVAFPDLGQIFTPAWSPDGRSLAFAALRNGFSDLYLYDLEKGTTRRLTDDPFADLQPSWSPDGSELMFITDRYTTDLATLSFGASRMATITVTSGMMRPVAAFENARHVDPQWSRDGASVYFLADPDGIANVYRLALGSGELFQITRTGGVSGLTASSPAFSLASTFPRLAFSTYRDGRFEIRILEGDDLLEGVPAVMDVDRLAAVLPPVVRDGSLVASLLADPVSGLPPARAPVATVDYRSTLALEALGQPFLSSGSGHFGTFVRGGMSMLFADMLGDRKLALAAQIGNQRGDRVIQARFLNRTARWNWGLDAEIAPQMRGRIRTSGVRDGAEPTLARDTERLRQMHHHVGARVAYPFSRTSRVELGAGVRHVTYARDVRARVFSLRTGRVLEDSQHEAAAGAGVTLGDASVALVSDTAIAGPTSPILGGRSRVELAPAIGGLAFSSVLVDYRRYLMPVRPYTLALRAMHMGRYGADADDPRLFPMFVGYRHLVRGYDYAVYETCRMLPQSAGADRSVGAYSDPGAEGAMSCAPSPLRGSRALVANAELRVPLAGALTGELTYGTLPAEAFVFFDAGVAWTGARDRSLAGAKPMKSVGAGVRVNAFGLIAELGAIRPLDRPNSRWGFLVNFRPGF